MKWDTGSDGYAIFEIREQTSSRVKLACVGSGWDFMKSWNLWSKNLNTGIISSSLSDRTSPFLSDSPSNREGWKCDYYQASSSDQLSKSKFLFTQYIKTIDFADPSNT